MLRCGYKGTFGALCPYRVSPAGIYRQISNGLLLAWDPIYPSIIGTAARSCFLPQDQRSVIQCTSTVGTNTILLYQSVTYLTSTVTVTDADGRTTRQANAQLTNVPTLTVVKNSAATIFAPPVNGFNIVQRQAAGSTTSSGTTSSASSTVGSGGTTTTASQGSTQQSEPRASDTSAPSSSPRSGLTPGVIAGAAMGAVAGLGLVLLGAFLLFRRRRNRPSPVEGIELPAEGQVPEPWYYAASPQGRTPVEMSATRERFELQGYEYAHELPGQNYR